MTPGLRTRSFESVPVPHRKVVSLDEFTSLVWAMLTRSTGPTDRMAWEQLRSDLEPLYDRGFHTNQAFDYLFPERTKKCQQPK